MKGQLYIEFKNEIWPLIWQVQIYISSICVFILIWHVKGQLYIQFMDEIWPLTYQFHKCTHMICVSFKSGMWKVNFIWSSWMKYNHWLLLSYYLPPFRHIYRARFHNVVKWEIGQKLCFSTIFFFTVFDMLYAFEIVEGKIIMFWKNERKLSTVRYFYRMLERVTQDMEVRACAICWLF